MPKTQVLMYRDNDGSVPVLDWLHEIQGTNRMAFDKCLFLLELLEQLGSELRRPRADYLRDGVYELRTEVRGVNYRLLYGFVGKNVALVAHGLTKKKKVRDRDVDLAESRLRRFRSDPAKHTAAEGDIDG